MATTPYLDLAGYKALSRLPAATIDRVETETTGSIAAILVERSAHINARLTKVYACPFASPYPEIVQGWLARLADAEIVEKAGFQPTDDSALKIEARADVALAEIKEAANAKDGLFDLPLRADTTASGISKNEPLGYGETSPYVGNSRQFDRAIDEDAARTGSGDAID